MPLKTDPAWEERVLSLKENNKSWGAGRIATALGQEAANDGLKTPPPSEATVRRILRRRWDKMPEEERRQYQYFFWPESMERIDLPWEASASALELLCFLDQRGGGRNERPSVHFMRWFWRVSQASPGCAIVGRIMAATILVGYELSGLHIPMEGVEWWLAYRPWEGKTQLKSYGEAITRAEHRIPGLHWVPAEWGGFSAGLYDVHRNITKVQSEETNG